MTDEFVEHDLGTPSEAELDAAYSSQYLGVVDVGPKKIKTTLAKVAMQEIKDRNSGKPKKRAVVYFENIVDPNVSFGGKQTGGCACVCFFHLRPRNRQRRHQNRHQ